MCVGGGAPKRYFQKVAVTPSCCLCLLSGSAEDIALALPSYRTSQSSRCYEKMAYLINVVSVPLGWWSVKGIPQHITWVQRCFRVKRSLFWFNTVFPRSEHKLSDLLETRSHCQHYSLLTPRLSSSLGLTPFIMSYLPQCLYSSSNLSPLITTFITHPHSSSPHMYTYVCNIGGSKISFFHPRNSWLPYKAVMQPGVGRDGTT